MLGIRREQIKLFLLQGLSDSSESRRFVSNTLEKEIEFGYFGISVVSIYFSISIDSNYT